MVIRRDHRRFESIVDQRNILKRVILESANGAFKTHASLVFPKWSPDTGKLAIFFKHGRQPAHMGNELLRDLQAWDFSFDQCMPDTQRVEYGTAKTMRISMGHDCILHDPKDHFIARPIRAPYMRLNPHGGAVAASRSILLAIGSEEIGEPIHISLRQICSSGFGADACAQAVSLPRRYFYFGKGLDIKESVSENRP